MSNNRYRRRALPQPRLQPNDAQLKFSFKHIDLGHYKFDVHKCNPDFMRQLIIRLRDYSDWTVERFRDQNNNQHRHIIDFDKTSEINGFNLDQDQLAPHEAWQFEVCPQSDWRVHGMLIDDILYLIWLDPEHRLYRLGEG